MIAILVSSLIHSSKTVLAMSAEDGGISSTRRPFVVYTTSGNIMNNELELTARPHTIESTARTGNNYAICSGLIAGNFQWVQFSQINHLRGLVQSPCGKINVIMTLGGEGVLAHDVIQLHCQQTGALVVNMQSCG